MVSAMMPQPLLNVHGIYFAFTVYMSRATIPTCRLGGLIAFTVAVLVQRDCFPDGPRKKVVFAFIYSQISTQALVIISEVLVAIVSSGDH